MTRLFVEGQEVDLSQDLSHQLTFAVDDLINIDSKSTSFSKTIIIPGTANNNKLFGNIFENSNSNFYDPGNPNIYYDFNAIRPAQARIEINGLQAMKGVMRLLGITIDNGNVEYEVALFGELGGFVAALGNSRLQDLDFSAYNQNWNKDNIIASWQRDNYITLSVQPTITGNLFRIVTFDNWFSILNVGDSFLLEGTLYNDGVYVILNKIYSVLSGVLYIYVQGSFPQFEFGSIRTLTITKIVNQARGGVCFPLIDYGGVSGDKIDYDFSAFRPALFVKEYMDKIITGAGYTYTSNFFDTHFFNQLIIPNNDDRVYKYDATNYVDAETTELSFNWFLQNIQPYTGSNLWINKREYLPFETINNIYQFTAYNSNGKYISNVTSTRSIKCKFNAKIKVRYNEYLATGGPFFNVKLKLYFNIPNNQIDFEMITKTN